MKHLHVTMCALAAIAASVMISCSSRDEHKLLESIPSEATSVTVFDLDRAGADGVSPKLLPVTAGTGLAVKVTMPDGYPFTIAEAPATDSLTAHGFKVAGEADGDLTPYADESGIAAIVNTGKSLVYYIASSAPRALERVKVIEEAVGKLNFTSNKGIVNYFDRNSGDAVCYGAVSRSLTGSQAASPEPQEAQWLAFNVKQESEIADIALNIIQGSGKDVKIKGLQTISPDFLRYVPADMNVVAAVGLTPEIDWDAASRMMAIVTDRTTAGYIAAATPYLKSIDGTVAVAVGTDNPADPQPGNSRFLAMAHMDRAKIDDFVRQAGGLAAIAGATSQEVSPSLVKYAVPGAGDIYLGNVDGYLVISSYLPDGKAQNPFASSMEGHDAAAVITFPAGALPAAQYPGVKGLDIKMTIDESDAHVRVSFPGSDRKPLAILSEMLAR